VSSADSTEEPGRRLDGAGDAAQAPASQAPSHEQRGSAGVRAGNEERSFEELQRELEEIVGRLERGDVPVDDAIALFKRGEELHRACVERLEAAQVRIEELSHADPRDRP
jgi:exodeoxyribonuclease VII small subunit